MPPLSKRLPKLNPAVICRVETPEPMLQWCCCQPQQAVEPDRALSCWGHLPPRQSTVAQPVCNSYSFHAVEVASHACHAAFSSPRNVQSVIHCQLNARISTKAYTATLLLPHAPHALD